MTVSYIGLGAILATLNEAYQILKWAGVVYVGWSGISQIIVARGRVEEDLLGAPNRAPVTTSQHAGFPTGVLNPKALLFCAAFLGQFMNPAYPMTSQFLILMVVSMMAVFTVLSGFAWLAGDLRSPGNHEACYS